ncbi:MAG: hypothetical protein OHK0029_33940 [Armatimonadaceae bacterium]
MNYFTSFNNRGFGAIVLGIVFFGPFFAYVTTYLMTLFSLVSKNAITGEIIGTLISGAIMGIIAGVMRLLTGNRHLLVALFSGLVVFLWRFVLLLYADQTIGIEPAIFRMYALHIPFHVIAAFVLGLVVSMLGQWEGSKIGLSPPA